MHYGRGAILNTKRILLAGRVTQHGFSLDIAPRQETLHECRVCNGRYSRSDMRWVGEKLVCVGCAGDAQEESEE